VNGAIVTAPLGHKLTIPDEGNSVTDFSAGTDTGKIVLKVY